jgi:hypothetical protein
MRLLVILLLGLSINAQGGLGDTSVAYLKGQTRDCFAGKLYHPAKVDIYLFDARTSEAIPRLIHRMEAYGSTGDVQSSQEFFKYYGELLKLVKKSKALGHVRSDQSGTFHFSDVPAGAAAVVVGISPREDDPAFYAYEELGTLHGGENPVTLDFNHGTKCQ